MTSKEPDFQRFCVGWRIADCGDPLCTAVVVWRVRKSSPRHENPMIVQELGARARRRGRIIRLLTRDDTLKAPQARCRKALRSTWGASVSSIVASSRVCWNLLIESR